MQYQYKNLFPFTKPCFTLFDYYYNRTVLVIFFYSLVLYWINPAGVFYVGLMILIGTGFYFGVLVLMRGFGKEEVGFLKGIFRV